MNKTTIQLLGQVQGAAKGALSILGANGPRELQLATNAGQAVLAVAAADGPAAERVVAAVSHLEGNGSLRAALAAHLPHLPGAPLAAALALVEGLTAAVADDGKLSPGEIMALVAAAIQEVA